MDGKILRADSLVDFEHVVPAKSKIALGHSRLTIGGRQHLCRAKRVPRGLHIATTCRGSRFQSKLCGLRQPTRPFFSGHSSVFNPQGEMIKKAGRTEAIMEAEIDLQEVARWRTEEQIFPHRRPLLYREIPNRHRAEAMAVAGKMREPQSMSPYEKREQKVA